MRAALAMVVFYSGFRFELAGDMCSIIMPSSEWMRGSRGSRRVTAAANPGRARSQPAASRTRQQKNKRGLWGARDSMLFITSIRRTKALPVGLIDSESQTPGRNRRAPFF
jgi:hypothetical protein